MSKKPVEVKLKLRGINQLMKSPEIKAVLQEKGEQVKRAAEEMSNGGEYETEIKTGRWIATEFVRAKDHKALQSNYEDNTLLKALNSAKDE